MSQTSARDPAASTDVPAPDLERLPDGDEILDLLRDRVGVVDVRGRLVRANRAWREAEGPPECLAGTAYTPGDPYLDRLDALDTVPARELAGGVRSVLKGREEIFHLEFEVEQADAWYAARVTPAGTGTCAVLTLEDITRRKRFERRLVSSEVRFRQLADHVNEVFYLKCVRTGALLFVSRAYEEVWGRSRQSLYDEPLSWLEAVHPADRPAVEAVLPSQSGEPRSLEFRILRPDGTVRWIHNRTFPIRDDSGRSYRIAGLSSDVTERKLIEGALLRSEEELRAVLSRIPVGVVIHREQEIVYLNETAARYVGYESASDVPGQPLMELLHPDDRRKAAERIAAMARTGRPVEPREVRVRHRSGGWVTLYSSPIQVLEYEGEPAYLLALWDITPQRRAEAALRESEDRYRAIVESASLGIALLGLDGRALTLNRALRAFLGGVEDDERRPLEDRVHPDAWEDFRRQFRQVARGQRDGWEAELRYQRPDGSTLWALSSFSLVRGDDGEPRFVVAIVEDVTERKTLEDQLRLAQRIESIGRLAGGIAHDFNNLITVITGHTDLLLEEVDAESLLHPDLEQIRQAGERAAALTGQLLAFSRRQVLQPRVIDLNWTVGGMEEMLRRIIGEDVELRIEPTEGGAAVRADPGQIEQVILNLAVNARDAMPRGGELTIRTANVELDEAFARRHLGARPGPHVRLEVRDSGEGMDAETLAHVFEPFFTTKDPGKGTGLGLAMAYGIVKQSEGYIMAESEPERGASFSIYLPRVQEEPEEEANRRRGPGPSGHETILLVEDEEMVRSLAERVLSGKGYRVLVAENGRRALEVAEHYDEVIHLLLTDVIMPRLGGGELAEELTARRPETRVLFMSGYTDDAVVRHGVVDLGTAFLPKPFTPDELTRKVRQVLDGAA